MISFNENALIDLVMNKMTIDNVAFGTVKLGCSIDDIDITEINDIYVETPSQDGYNYENSNYTIRERLEQLHTRDGWIHLAGGLACGVENQVVSHFRMSRRYVEKIKHFTREEVISFHGAPEYELIDYSPWDDMVIDNYILVYNRKKLNFFIEPGEDTIKEIFTGELEKARYTMR